MGTIYVSDADLLDAVDDEDVIIDRAREICEDALYEWSKDQIKFLAEHLGKVAYESRGSGNISEAMQFEDIARLLC